MVIPLAVPFQTFGRLLKWEPVIHITLNGNAKDLPGAMTLTDLIRHVQQIPELIVAEVNEKIYKRDQYPMVTVNDGDVVELLKFVGGG